MGGKGRRSMQLNQFLLVLTVLVLVLVEVVVYIECSRKVRSNIIDLKLIF